MVIRYHALYVSAKLFECVLLTLQVVYYCIYLAVCNMSIVEYDVIGIVELPVIL